MNHLQELARELNVNYKENKARKRVYLYKHYMLSDLTKVKKVIVVQELNRDYLIYVWENRTKTTHFNWDSINKMLTKERVSKKELENRIRELALKYLS